MECILFKQKNPGFAHFICIAGEGIHFLIGSEGESLYVNLAFYKFWIGWHPEFGLIKANIFIFF